MKLDTHDAVRRGDFVEGLAPIDSDPGGLLVVITSVDALDKCHL